MIWAKGKKHEQRFRNKNVKAPCDKISISLPCMDSNDDKIYTVLVETVRQLSKLGMRMQRVQRVRVTI